MTDLAKNITRLRRAKNLTQPELAELLGTDRETVTAWERADITPDMEQLSAIAEALDTDAVTLLYPVAEASEEKSFRPGCSFVFGSVVLYYLLCLIAGTLGAMLGLVAFIAICTAMILEAISKR